MQLLHALDLGTNSRMDKLAEDWIEGRIKPGALQGAIYHTESKARIHLDRKLERERIAAIRKQETEDYEDDEQLLALFQAVEDIQEANKERASGNKLH